MTSFDDAGLDARRRALVEAALAADPALAEELELITGCLGERAARSFWSRFADDCVRTERPASAVLAALEHAAARGLS